MDSEKIEILNIPNFYCTFYLKVLTTMGRVSFVGNTPERKYDFSPLIVFRIRGKLLVIDNNDPVGIDPELYEAAAIYFATNKLIDHPDYQQKKVQPLFPHYPINNLQTYFNLFGMGFKSGQAKQFLRESVRIWKRPVYREPAFEERQSNFVFFSGSIWEKERQANLVRADFIRFCLNHEQVDFEGGFVPRNDGENQGLDEFLNKKHYSPKKFNELSRRSILGFNNPAVLGAISWRFAEYLNSGTAVVSLPFKIEMPFFPEDGKEILMLQGADGIESKLDSIVRDRAMMAQVGRGGKEFFTNNCSIQSQAIHLLEQISR